MDVLDRDTLLLLAGHRGWPSVSVYLPTHPIPLETDEDRIRLKNLVRDACDQLVDQGMRRTDADAVCAPVTAMLADHTFWHDTGNGMALFVTEGQARALKLDIPLPEQAIVGDRYYLRPLIAAHGVDQSFWALALDKNRTRLFRGDRRGIDEVLLGDTPVTMEEAMKYEDASRNLTHHSITPGRVASRGNQHQGSVYAGYGGEKDVDTEQTTRFARIVERGVSEALRGSHAPLLLLGTERLVAAYREVNTYQDVAEQTVTGASDYLTPQQVHATALETLAPVFFSAVEAGLFELSEREGTDLASRDPQRIVTAAATGRVKTLFFDDSVGPYGVLDRESFEVKELCEGSPRFLRERRDATSDSDGACGWDLVDLAAAETVLHGGEVHAFTGEDSPLQGVGAVFRY